MVKSLADLAARKAVQRSDPLRNPRNVPREVLTRLDKAAVATGGFISKRAKIENAGRVRDPRALADEQKRQREIVAARRKAEAAAAKAQANADKTFSMLYGPGA